MSDRTQRGPWPALRRYTQARLALGRAGDSLPTSATLEFALAHAQARDAVHRELDLPHLQSQLSAAGFQSVATRSAVGDRMQYLRRPDMGRRLCEESQQLLHARAPPGPAPLVFVIADGLSALAVMRHAVPLLQALQPLLADEAIAPIVIAQQARVALGDEIGELWQAEQVLVLIGERPGLSAADSLGVYLTHAPRIGCSDAQRNCLSNVRQQGLGYAEAARRLVHLIREARRLGGSGVALKDESDRPTLREMDEDRGGDQSERS